jgi:hypothetical protein
VRVGNKISKCVGLIEKNKDKKKVQIVVKIRVIV